jgi:hypothetical protein
VERGEVSIRAEGGSFQLTKPIMRRRVERAPLVVLAGGMIFRRDEIPSWESCGYGTLLGEPPRTSPA